MFPRDLADGLFSLHLGHPTAALSVHMMLNSDGSLDECGIVASTVTPTRKLTYHEVDELLEETMPEQEPMLWALHQVNTCDAVECCCTRLQEAVGLLQEKLAT